MTFIGGSEALRVSDLTEAEMVAQVITHLASLLGPWVSLTDSSSLHTLFATQGDGPCRKMSVLGASGVSRIRGEASQE